MWKAIGRACKRTNERYMVPSAPKGNARFVEAVGSQLGADIRVLEILEGERDRQPDFHAPSFRDAAVCNLRDTWPTAL